MQKIMDDGGEDILGDILGEDDTGPMSMHYGHQYHHRRQQQQQQLIHNLPPPPIPKQSWGGHHQAAGDRGIQLGGTMDVEVEGEGGVEADHIMETDSPEIQMEGWGRGELAPRRNVDMTIDATVPAAHKTNVTGWGQVAEPTPTSGAFGGSGGSGWLSAEGGGHAGFGTDSMHTEPSKPPSASWPHSPPRSSRRPPRYQNFGENETKPQRWVVESDEAHSGGSVKPQTQGWGEPVSSASNSGGWFTENSSNRGNASANVSQWGETEMTDGGGRGSSSQDGRGWNSGGGAGDDDPDKELHWDYDEADKSRMRRWDRTPDVSSHVPARNRRNRRSRSRSRSSDRNDNENLSGRPRRDLSPSRNHGSISDYSGNFSASGNSVFNFQATSNAPRRSRSGSVASFSEDEQEDLTEKNLNIRYFVMKSLTLDHVKKSQEYGVWATQPRNALALSEAWRKSDKLYLIFSVNESRHFQGYAEMIADVGSVEHAPWQDIKGTQLGKNFRVKWRLIKDLPFHKTMSIKNPYNEGKPVKISKDGQELHPDSGKALLKLFQKHDAPEGVNCTNEELETTRRPSFRSSSRTDHRQSVDYNTSGSGLDPSSSFSSFSRNWGYETGNVGGDAYPSSYGFQNHSAEQRPPSGRQFSQPSSRNSNSYSANWQGTRTGMGMSSSSQRSQSSNQFSYHQSGFSQGHRGYGPRF